MDVTKKNVLKFKKKSLKKYINDTKFIHSILKIFGYILNGCFFKNKKKFLKKEK